MSLPYLLRLLCLCLASFFLVNAFAGLLVSFFSRGAIHAAEKMQPRSGTRFLFFLRLLPLTLGVTAVLGLCVPSYLWLEPQDAPERVGLLCITLALLATASWLLSIMRVFRAIAFSLRCKRIWQQAGWETYFTGDSSPVLVVGEDAPLLALAGVFRPRLVISDGVLRSLSSRQLDVALRHENAHRVSRDNLKRLFLLLAPHPLPFVHGFSFLEKAWAKFAEWAADDAATRGDSLRALSLASALLCIARMGAGPRPSFLHTSLVAGDQNLAARIDRLLHAEPAGPEPVWWAPFPERAAALLVASSLTTLLFWPVTLSTVHRLLEQFLR
jgi:Zn-dependent protease with chaperone function